MKNTIIKIERELFIEMELNCLGYNLDSFYDYYAIYINTKKDISHKIVYSLFPVGGKVYLSQLNYSIISRIVNTVLYSILDNNFNMFEDTVIDRKGFEYSKLMRNDMSILVLEDKNVYEQNINKIAKLFKVYYSEFALPFFSGIHSLEDINNNILEKEDWKNWSDFIFGKTYFKAMIILKIVGNDEGYEKFIKMYIPRIEEGIKAGREDLKQYFEDVKKLDQYLEGGAYKDLLN